MGVGAGDINFTIWSVVWLLLLIFIGWPLAWFFVWLYCIVMPIAVCVSGLKDCQDLLWKVVQLPKTCAEGIVSGKSVGK